MARNNFQQQEQQQFNQGQQLTQQTAANQQQLLTSMVPGYRSMLQNPGYTSQEKAGIQSASDQAIAGAYGDAETQAKAAAARTGNRAGLTTALHRMAQSKARDTAQGQAGLQEQFANHRIAGQQAALSGMGGLYSAEGGTLNTGAGIASNALNQEGESARKPGFWSSLAQAAVKGAAQGATSAAMG